MIWFRVRRPNFNLFDSRRNLILLVTFLLLFPKGGIKIHNVPITWGYILLGIFSVVAILRKPIFVHRERLNALIALAPFLIICAFTMIINGINSLEMTLSFWISFLFLPVLFFILFSKDVETFNERLFFRLFTVGIFTIAAYGIFLFIFKQMTGHFLEIPFLTVNINDLGHLEDKCINRGNVFKLISTYNNGNIYGICLLMLLPLYCFLEPSHWRPWIVKLSLFMTLSRTIWIGLFFHEICYRLIICKKEKASLVKGIAALILFVGLLTILSSYYGFYLNFFIDSSFGGRKTQLETIFNVGIFSSEPFSGISEIVYAGIISAFGWAGLLAYIFAMSGPLLYQIRKHPLSQPRQCIALGLVTYLFISASDGAILSLPTLAFYWFLLSLLFRKDLIAQQTI